MGQQALIPITPFVTRNLFSQHYLEHNLKETKEWKNDSGLNEAFEAIQLIWQARMSGASKSRWAVEESSVCLVFLAAEEITMFTLLLPPIFWPNSRIVVPRNPQDGRSR